MDGRVTTRVTGAVGEIIISNPDRKNAMSGSMWRELRECTIELQANDYARVVIVRGSDAMFVSGADISEFKPLRDDPESSTNYFLTMEDALNAIFNLTKPTIAAIEGHCIGGGVSIAVACDFRFASQDAVFQIPTARLGLTFPKESLRRLASLIGVTHAKRLLFTANVISATEAKAINLISENVDHDLRTGVDELCASIQDNAPLSIMTTKKMLNSFTGQDLELGELTKQYQTLTLSSRDFSEAINSLEEKRKPNFIGK